jgi:Protein-L-isoaspartate(D-aspartate) O-methyltransferase (PCMT)
MNIHLRRDFSRIRNEMVEQAIIARGVRSELVLNAIRNVPREAFLPEQLREFAYEDAPLPIDADQTISQPYIVAFMTEALALQGGETVLEIGAGSGYAAAVLSRIAGEVYTVERIGQLAEKAASTTPINRGLEPHRAGSNPKWISVGHFLQRVAQPPSIMARTACEPASLHFGQDQCLSDCSIDDLEVALDLRHRHAQLHEM